MRNKAYITGFDIDETTNFAEEVQKTKRNKKLAKFLDARRTVTKGKKRTVLKDVRQELGLA